MTICTTFEFALLLRSQCAVAVHVLIVGHEPVLQQRLYVLYVGNGWQRTHQRASVRGIPSCFSLRSLRFTSRKIIRNSSPTERETGSARNDRLVISEGLPCGTEWRRRTDRFWERMASHRPDRGKEDPGHRKTHSVRKPGHSYHPGQPEPDDQCAWRLFSKASSKEPVLMSALCRKSS